MATLYFFSEIECSSDVCSSAAINSNPVRLSAFGPTALAPRPALSKQDHYTLRLLLGARFAAHGMPIFGMPILAMWLRGTVERDSQTVSLPALHPYA